MKVLQHKQPFYFVFALSLFCVTLLCMGKTATADTMTQGFTGVVKQAMPAVVHIRVEKTSTQTNRFRNKEYEEFYNNPFFERFFGPQFKQPTPRSPRKFKQQGQGSGFIFSKDGRILTNNHVVEGADTITVILSDDKEYKAELVGTDPQSDVAVIKIQNGDDLPVLPLGNSDNLEVGEWVIAIGNPFGLSQTVTAGVVSGKGRSRVGINEYENFIQTDAAINPGNSGGPLINTRGEVVGINSALFTRTGGYMGIGFAIPINMVKAIEDQLQEHGKVTRGWLGVVIQDVDDNLAESFGLPSTAGILVSEVQKNSPAEKAGLKQGDVIVQLEDIVLKDVTDLRNRVAMVIPQTSVKFTVVRDAKRMVVPVVIGEQPANFGKVASAGSGETSLQSFGLLVQDLTPELARQFGYDEGVLVSKVEPGSAAADAGFAPGLLIEEINQQRVRNVKDIQRIVEKSQIAKRVLLRVRKGEMSRYVVLVAP